MWRFTFLAVLLVGCTGSDPVAPFIGTWRYVLASQVITRCGGDQTAADLVGSVTYTREGDAIHPNPASLSSFAGDGCLLDLRVTSDDTIADLVPRDDCTFVTTAGAVNVSFSTYRLTRASVYLTPTDPGQDGLALDLDALVTGVQSPDQCTVTASATMLP